MDNHVNKQWTEIGLSEIRPTCLLPIVIVIDPG